MERVGDRRREMDKDGDEREKNGKTLRRLGGDVRAGLHTRTH